MESSSSERNSPETKKILSDNVLYKLPENSEQEKIADNGDTDIVGMVTTQKSPINMTKRECHQEGVDTVNSLVNGDGGDSSAIIPLELSNDICSEACQRSGVVSKLCNEDHVSLVPEDLIKEVVGSGEVQSNDSEKIGSCEVQSNDSDKIGSCEVQSNDSVKIGSCEVQLNDSEKIGSCEVQSNDSEKIGSCEVQSNDSEKIGSCEVQSNDSEKIKFCEVQSNDSEEIGSCAVQSNDSDKIGSFEVQSNDSDKIGSCEVQSNDLKKIGSCEVQSNVSDKIGFCEVQSNDSDKIGSCEVQSNVSDKIGSCEVQSNVSDKIGSCEVQSNDSEKIGSCEVQSNVSDKIGSCEVQSNDSDKIGSCEVQSNVSDKIGFCEVQSNVSDKIGSCEVQSNVSDKIGSCEVQSNDSDKIGSCEVQSNDSEKIGSCEVQSNDQNSGEVMVNGSSVLASSTTATTHGNQEGEVALQVLQKDVKDGPPPERELRISLESLERSTAFFEMSRRLPQIVIDLRQPPLVQVCTLYSAVDNSAAASSSNGRYNAVTTPRRPQTAVRGRNRKGNYSTRHPPSLLDRYSQAESTSQINHHPNSDDECQIVQAEPPNEDVVLSGARRSLRSAAKTYQAKNDLVSDSEPKQNSKRYRKTSESNSDSDEDTMKVQTVNRTYARFSYTPQRSVMSTEDNEATMFKHNSSSVTHEDNWQKQHNDNYDRKRPKLSKSFISVESSKQDMSSKSNGLNKSKSHKNKLKIKTRVGPAWYSRKFLSSPPSQSNQLDRINMSFAVVKRHTYSLGQRHCPLPRHGKLLFVMKKFKVQSEETSELDNVGRESLMLWRMSSDDVEELQSQLSREAEHRRVDRAMPVVMQLSDDQIETVYKRVAESMNTFDIVAADSEEEEAESDDEDANEDKYGDILDEYHRMVAEQEKLDKEKLPAFETEYARTRPKRLAVDYGPSAFAPILLMEGRRLSTGHSTGIKSVPVAPKSNTKMSSITNHKRKKSSHKSSKVSRKQHCKKKEGDELDCVEIESVTTGLQATQHKLADKILDSEKPTELTTHCLVVSERRCLFDELSHPLENMDTVEPVKEVKTDVVKSTELLRDSSSTESVLTDAPELSAPPGVNDTSPCSPPPDLGLPML